MQTRASVIETCSPSVGLELQLPWPVIRALLACVTDPSKPTYSWAGQGDTWHVLLEDLGASCVTPLGRDSWKLAPGCLWISSPVPFLFADFALYPFTVMNINGENDNCWVPWVLLMNDQTRGWPWRAPTQYPGCFGNSKRKSNSKRLWR